MPPPPLHPRAGSGHLGIDGARRGRRGRRPRPRLRRAHPALSAARLGRARPGGDLDDHGRGGAARAGRGARDRQRDRRRRDHQPARDDDRLGARHRQPDPSRDRLAVPPHGRDVRRAEGGRARKRWCASAPGSSSTRTSPAPRSPGCSTTCRGPGARAERGELAFGTVDSWLVWKLTGGRVHATDATNASRTLCLDLRTLAWDEEMLARLTIPREVLPTVVDSAGLIAETSDVGLAAGRRADRRASPAISRRRSSARRASRSAAPRTPTAPAASCC